MGMYDEALRSAYDYCFNNCPEGIDFTDIDTLNLSELGKLRNKCARCKDANDGIYKLDAILTAYKGQTKAVSLEGEVEALKGMIERYKEAITDLLEQLQKTSKEKVDRNVGRKPTIAKTYGKKIDALKKEGKSQRAIAEQLGISTTSVNNYLKGKYDVIAYYGEDIKKLKELGKNVDEISEQLGISKTTVKDFLSGKLARKKKK
jgi:predicted transcriptional regulator